MSTKTGNSASADDARRRGQFEKGKNRFVPVRDMETPLCEQDLHGADMVRADGELRDRMREVADA